MTRRNIELGTPLHSGSARYSALRDDRPQSGRRTRLGKHRRAGGYLRLVHRLASSSAQIRTRGRPGDSAICFALSSIGIAFVTRLAPDLAVRQVAWLVLGIIFMIAVIIFMKNMDKTANYKYTLMVIGLILLLSPLLPGIGNEIYGSRIWLSIGSFSFQPGEIAKIFIVLFLAGYLAQNREMLSVFTHKVGPFKFPDLSTLLPLLIMWLLSMAIVVFEKDLGSALIVYFVFLTMLYVASGKKFYLIVGLLTIAIGAVILFFFFSHVQVRVDTWLDPFADPTNTGYQLVPIHLLDGRWRFVRRRHRQRLG